MPLSRMMPLLSGIVTRTTYLELLSEFPGALKHLISSVPPRRWWRTSWRVIRCCWTNCSIRIRCTSRRRRCLPRRAASVSLRVPGREDEEQQLEALRQFEQAQMLLRGGGRYRRHPAGNESERPLNLAGGSDHRRGCPSGVGADGGSLRAAETPSQSAKAAVFAVVGYGKLGGWELGQLRSGSDFPPRLSGRRHDRRRT